MKPIPPFAPLASIALLGLLSACGGGSGGVTDSDGNGDAAAPAPQTGAASGGGDAEPAAGSRSLSGRVADGYLRGARVCVDLDEDETCGADEPSAITGEGGSWTLELAPDQEGKPVIADIPATAIDEDTGEAIGRALVFTAPADKPEFLSPITTLVQQELRANPALDVTAAERVVKSSLGLGDDEDVSLFEDYVAKEREEGGDSRAAERFRYLHDTARVITSMMQDIEEQVSAAATAQNHDVAGSDVGRAIREIVREEVRDLLPAIAREVATLVDEAADTGADAGGGANGARFDPKRIAELLRPADAADSVDERINAIREREAPEPADLEALLTAGVYWMEVDCEGERHGPEPLDAPERTSATDSGSTTFVEPDEHGGERDGGADRDRCRAFHGFTRIDESGQLQTTEFNYDGASGQWIEVTSDDEVDFGYAELVLLDGRWVRNERGAPEGVVRFTDDGAAIIADTFGDTTLYGATRSLEGVSLGEHLREGDGPRVEFEDVRELFPEGSTVTRLKVLESVPTHILHSYPDADPSDGFDCSEFGYNCNVVHALIDGAHVAQLSLDEMRASIGTGGLDVLGVGEMTDDDLVTVMRLMADVSADGSLSSSGTVHWMGRSYHGAPYPDGDASGAPLEGYDHEFVEGQHGFVEGQHEFVEGQFEVDQGPYQPVPGEYGAFPDGYQPKPDDLPPLEKRFGTRWKLVEVDGVEVIEIELPALLRFHDDDGEHGDSDRGEESDRALLLAEHEGFVRQGVRLPGQRVDSVRVYNENAFGALRALLETMLAGVGEAR